ncbi:MAG: SET domain-containing protein [Candidatus Rokuibacteriota bacterium]
MTTPLTYRSPKTEVRPSPIQGKGLFATRAVAKGEIPERDASMLYTNHSCDPNLAIQGQIVLVAMRDIAPGEELTIDWATTDDGDHEMQCRCGSAHCRGTVTGKDWMKTELQAKYAGWFCWFLQRKIDASGGRNP